MLRDPALNLLRAASGKCGALLSAACMALCRIALLCLTVLAAQTVHAMDVVEFYNTNLDNYFITANATEAAAIDSGSAGPGWSRTGMSFKSGGGTSVCRFYGSISPGPNSHFYTAIASECESLKQLQAATPATQKRWNFESLDFLTTEPIKPVTGDLYCASGLAPVYRAYNNGYARGVDSNHRISSDLGAIQQVVARGWISEGIVMCAPPATTPVSTCKAGVSSGFSGDLNAIYTDRGGGGGGNGEGGGGGAGAGGGEGKILGALVTVTRISDGALLGSALTDNFNGLITIKPCTSDGPLLLTMSGQSGAVYYDEAKGALIPFGVGQVLHAVVDYLDENVGVSALTEAAFRYALNNFKGASAADLSGAAQLSSTGSVTGLTLAQIQTANQVTLNAFNKMVDSSAQLVSVKSLPTPIDKNSASNALPVNRYGIAATILGGFVKAAGAYQPNSATPALGSTEQLARDLTDGKLDGTALDGTAAATGTNAYYLAPNLPAALRSGMTSMAQQFGQGTTSTLLTVPAAFVGNWRGTYSGDDVGSFSLTIDASGNIAGSAVSQFTGETFALTGTVSKSGVTTLGTATGGASFTGSFTQQGTASGTWSDTFGDVGTWKGSKV